MPAAVEFTVYGVAVPKARARTVRLATGRVVSFTPRSTQAWEEMIRHQAVEHRPEQPLDGPLVLEAVFYLPRPASAPRRRTLPDRKPDLDNLIKAIKDALEGLVWVNDSRLVELRVAKRYGSPPRVDIRVTPAEQSEHAQRQDGLVQGGLFAGQGRE